jgi:hypothetical protein
MRSECVAISPSSSSPIALQSSIECSCSRRAHQEASRGAALGLLAQTHAQGPSRAALQPSEGRC